jgi:hypothetical protein
MLTFAHRNKPNSICWNDNCLARGSVWILGGHGQQHVIDAKLLTLRNSNNQINFVFAFISFYLQL